MAIAPLTAAIRAAVAQAVVPLPPCTVYQLQTFPPIALSAAGGLLSSNPAIATAVSITTGGTATGGAVVFSYSLGGNASVTGVQLTANLGGIYAANQAGLNTTLTFSGTFGVGDFFSLGYGPTAPLFRIVVDMTSIGLQRRVYYLDQNGNPYTTGFTFNGVTYAPQAIPAAGGLTQAAFALCPLDTDPIPPSGAATTSQYSVVYQSTGLWYSPVASN